MKQLLISAILIFVIVGLSLGATRYSRADGNWNATSTWAATLGGAAGASVPVAGDSVYIVQGWDVTLTANAACASITFTTTTATSLTLAGYTLDVSGAITIPRSGSGFNQIIVGTGILNSGSVAFTSGGGNNRHQITISTGTVTVTGNVTQSGSTGSATIAFSGAGLLKLGGTFLTSTTGTLTLATGCTVEYNAAGAQTVGNFTYNNLTLSGSGSKTTTGVTVNGILSREGTATASAAPTYGGSSTLQYKGSSAQTTGVEFPATFARPVIINNANGVTLGGGKTMNGTITVNSGSTLNCGTNIISGTGTFTLSSGGSLGIGSTAGIAASGATGNIQTTTRSFSTAANYIYNGIAAQVTGSGLPATINNLTLNNSTGLSLSGSVTVSGTLTFTSGRINTGANTLTRSNLAGTGIKYLLSANNYIDITSAGITGITIQEYANTTPLNLAGTYDATKAVKRYYTISGVTGTGSASVRLDYLAGEQGGGYTYTSGNVWEYTGAGPWVNQGQLLAGQFYAETGSPISSANLAGDYSIGASDAALPIQLALFVGSFVGNDVNLNWQTISEINNFGFNVQRFNSVSKTYENIGFVEGKGTTLEPQSYSFIDENIKGSVEYRLEQIDNNGLKNYFGPIMLNPNGVGDNSVPAVFALNQNYPNPFNPSTVINYQLALDNYTTLKVYNLIGKEVVTLVEGYISAGSHKITFDGSQLSSGMYFYKLQSGSDVEVKKLTLMK